MAKPKNNTQLAELFRTIQIDGSDHAQIARLGNVDIFQTDRTLNYRLYSTVIATRDLDTEKITFSFGQGWYTMTTAEHMTKIANVKPNLNYAGGYASYRNSGITTFPVN